MCFTPLVGGGGGGGRRRGVDFQGHVWSLASPLVEKTQGHFLTQKESACQISADSEQLEKSQQNRYIRLSYTEPFKYIPASPRRLFGNYSWMCLAWGELLLTSTNREIFNLFIRKCVLVFQRITQCRQAWSTDDPNGWPVLGLILQMFTDFIYILQTVGEFKPGKEIQFVFPLVNNLYITIL